MLNSKALAASASVSAPSAVYVEDVFSTFLYTGNSSTQTITNGIDLSGNGGLVWIKNRNAQTNNILVDNSRPLNSYLASNLTNGNISPGWPAFVFNNNGFNLPSGSNSEVNTTAGNYCSWTFRKAAKFFDVVTYTGNGVSGRAIPHSLGSVPGCIMVKCTSAGSGFTTPRDWWVYHRGLASPSNFELRLNKTDAEINAGGLNATSTTFTVYGTSTGSNNSQNNVSGETYVAYLFAHDAGGFGTAGTDNVISCGSFTTNGSGFGSATLGYEPQWVMFKPSGAASNWEIYDNMRGLPGSAGELALLTANSSGAETQLSSSSRCLINPTGFSLTAGASIEYIYMTIRRGPMKTPTVGTSVFSAALRTGTATTTIVSSTTFPPDLLITKTYIGSEQPVWFDRLRGRALSLTSNSTSSDTVTTSTTNDLVSFNMDGITVGPNQQQAVNGSGTSIVDYNFRRAPGFFDVVAYTGTGSGVREPHNLTVRPELIIIKNRSATQDWVTVWLSPDGTNTYNKLSLNTTNAYSNPMGPDLSSWVRTYDFFTGYLENSSGQTPTNSGNNFVAYLFATLAGVSKVGSYTGTGTTKQIDCGFTTGARFVLIKRVDSTGDWYVWDTARGIISGNDPFFLLNTFAGQNTSTDYIDPLSSGFEISSTAPAAINANGGTYIFLSVA